MQKTSRFFSVLIALCTAALVLAGSIALPIVFRPFYYLQIDALNLPARTGYSQEVIRQAYDEMLDFCILGKPFGTGQLQWSAEGQSHFADVAVLFRLDFAVAITAALALLVCLAVYKLGRVRPARLWQRGPGFWAGSCLLVGVGAVTALAAADFDRAFVVFHTIFFPGKDNWLFDPEKDEIIQILPQEFFMHCAICIAVVLLLCCVVLIVSDFLLRRKNTARLTDCRTAVHPPRVERRRQKP